MKVDLLIHSASQLLTLSGGPQRGRQLGTLGILEGGALAIQAERIVDLGPSEVLMNRNEAEAEIDASGRVVMPGLVDPHTHLIWAGDRADEFERRVGGTTYLEIMESGGGIRATVRRTRQASLDSLVETGRARLREALAAGTTTLEAKTGYGLDLQTEQRMLQAIMILDQEGPWDLVPTFLGGHAIPEEYEGDGSGYTDYVVSEMLPAMRDWWRQQYPDRELPFFDAFCEEGAFDLGQTRRMLSAARSLGFPLKLHADEFNDLGGTELAVELGATSVDHLVQTSPQAIEALGKSVTVAVGLPCTPFGLGKSRYTPAADFLDANAVLALATDLNPGTAPCESMQFAMALAGRYMGLTPAQAIAASTINAAAALGRAEAIGSLEPGKLADVLILSVADYRQLGYRFGGNLAATVIKRGHIVHQNR